MDSLRLFAAIHIVPDDNFLMTYEGLKQALDYNIIKWVDPNNIHITLRFFGDTNPDEIPVISQALSKASKNIRPFTLTLEKTGIFGSKYDPKVIWFGIHENSPLQQLHSHITDCLADVEYFADRQNFVPHITVGRIKEIKDKRFFQAIIDRFANVSLLARNITEFSLYKSELKKEGPIHTVLETFKLAE
ncbi:MAG TPA: RNA 2',3'-cyclic phosphodiesterase [Lentimicrobium sp.]|nr:RNA 2',3'-cyclic phosphodiesterase [Lentimicrobium sp.]